MATPKPGDVTIELKPTFGQLADCRSSAVEQNDGGFGSVR